MTQLLLCAHSEKSKRQGFWDGEPGGPNSSYVRTVQEFYECPICHKTWTVGDPEPRVVLGKIIEEPEICEFHKVPMVHSYGYYGDKWECAKCLQEGHTPNGKNAPPAP